MMMATCVGPDISEVLCIAKSPAKKKGRSSALQGGTGRVDERFHVIEIPRSARRPGAVRRYSVRGRGPRTSSCTRCTAGVLEPARMHAEVAVGGVEQRLQVVERQRLSRRERADDAEPRAIMDDR